MLKLDEILVTRNWVGKPVRRKEDLRIVRGASSYVDDLDIDCYHAAFLRSPYAHARIVKVDTSRAEALPGVLAVITGDEVARQTKPVSGRAITKPAVQYVVASGKVRYVGEPVAAVVAETQYIAADALELIDVEYEALKPVVSIDDALDPASPLIFEEAGGNELLHDKMVHGDLDAAYREADLVLKEQFNVHRYSSTPLEPWAIIVKHETADDSFVIWSNDQQHGRSLANVSNTLGIPVNRLRMIVPDSGGGFGVKLALWPYIVSLSLLARKVNKPIKWIQTRTEHLQGGTHAPDARVDIELALKKDGRILALKMKDIQNDGSFVHTTGIYALIKFATMSGCYGIKATSSELVSVVTNRGGTVQNRGVGKPTMIFVLERMVDLAAKHLGLDPAEIRRLNMITPEQMPHTTPSGEVYESGNYPECLRRALELAGYEDFRKRQAELRKEGKYWGIGISAGVEPGTSNLGYYYTSRGLPEYMGSAEGAIVTVDYDGNLNVLLGSVDSGQGHGTTSAQVVADMLAIHPDRITVHNQLDSLISPFLGHSGVYSNKFNDVDLGSVVMATKKIRDKMLRIASHMLQLPKENLKLADGRICSVDEESKGVTFKDIAAIAYKQVLMLPENEEPGLKEVAYYRTPFAKMPNRENFNIQITHSNSVHIAILEVDIETGTVRPDTYVVVHDCGNQIHPGIVEGMLIGSTVHGIGASLLEEFVYDSEGQLLSSTFKDYLKPLAQGMPKFILGHMQSPCPYSLLGTKSAGEGGSITSLTALANAVEDALTPFDVKVTSLPLTPEKVMKALRETRVI